MKKLISVILIVLTGFAFAGCGQKVSLNDDNIVLAKRMVAAADAYLEGESTAGEAREIVEEAQARIDKDDDTTDTSGLEFSTAALLLSTNLLTEDAAGVKNARNDIAKLAGI